MSIQARFPELLLDLDFDGTQWIAQSAVPYFKVAGPDLKGVLTSIPQVLTWIEEQEQAELLDLKIEHAARRPAHDE